MPPPTGVARMPRTIHLALYGYIEHGPDEDMSWDLYQTEALARLRDVSLSSVPSHFVPHGMAASRFHHSVGVAYLARQLCSLQQELQGARQLLVAAALCHDTGSPPFSHISELFFHDLTGRTHEQQTELLLADNTELQRTLHSYGIAAAEVAAIINGEHRPLGPLLAGSIDLDNIDNSLHLLVSLGYHQHLPYHPLTLLQAFQVSRGRLTLDSRYLAELLGWAAARRTLYDLLSAAPNLSSSAMLYRALEYAYAKGSLHEEFFGLGESDALHHLYYECGPEAHLLVDRLRCWRQYQSVYTSSTESEDPRLVSLYSDWRLRKNFTDEIADTLGLEASALCLYVGRDRAEKNITLPFVGADAETAAALFRGRRGAQRLSVFADRHRLELRGANTAERLPEVAAAVRSAVSHLPETVEQPHVFF